jgi:hypothetical protein
MASVLYSGLCLGPDGWELCAVGCGLWAVRHRRIIVSYYLSTYLPIYLSTYLPNYLSTYLPTYLT